jgi:hypothetical protein
MFRRASRLFVAAAGVGGGSDTTSKGAAAASSSGTTGQSPSTSSPASGVATTSNRLSHTQRHGIHRNEEESSFLPPIILGGKVLGLGDNTNSEVLAARERALQPDQSVLLSRQMPVSLNSSFGTGDRSPIALAQAEEERRLIRQKKNFDDMIVFEGGRIADHETYGRAMLFRDFVHYALYHHKWGYVPKLWRKYRSLMTSNFHDPIAFASLRNQYDYNYYVGKQQEASPSYPTPAVIFQPYYGWVIAEYFVSIMRSKFDPAEPLIIYDIGCGQGTLASTILDFLAEQYPEIYARCEYHCIELLPHQIPNLRVKLVHHLHHVKIHHISILNWKELEPRRCFCLGMELLNGMPHDWVFWTNDGTAYEMWVKFEEKDNLGTAQDRPQPCTDPIILRYLRYARWMQEETFHALKVLCVTDGHENIDPPRWRTLDPEIYDPPWVVFTKSLVQHNPLQCMYLPTGSMVMLEVFSKFFPRHHALFADYRVVNHSTMGINAPLCQVKVRGGKDIFFRKVADHFLSNAGMVDVCFPTDFEMMTQVYKSICGEHKEVTSMNHPDFWKTFGGDKVSLFTTHSGWNPLLEDFNDFHVFATHHPSEA